MTHSKKQHVLFAVEQQTTAAKAKEHKEDKYTGMEMEKLLKRRSRAQGHEYCTKGFHGNEASRLCYTAETGTLEV